MSYYDVDYNDLEETMFTVEALKSSGNHPNPRTDPLSVHVGYLFYDEIQKSDILEKISGEGE